MTRRILFSLAVVMAAACASNSMDDDRRSEAAATSTASSSGYSAIEGTIPVGVIPAATVHDASRNKDVELSIDYPTRGGSNFPIIIFSHGFGGKGTGYEGLASYWTSHGYVVIRPTHADAGQLRSLRDVEDIWDTQKEAEWRNRVRDVTAVIDGLNDLEQRYPELKGKMDHTHIGVGGHSYGAFTTMLVAGAKPNVTPPLDLHDSRVRAAMAMSPQGIGAKPPLSAQSWHDVKIPMIYMTGSLDRSLDEKEDAAAWRRSAYENTPAGDKYFVEIAGARHLSFAGLGTGELMQRQRSQVDPWGNNRTTTGYDPRNDSRNAPGFGNQQRIFGTIKIVSLAFWDAYLKDKTTARDYLKGTQIEQLNGAGMVVLRK